MMKKMTISYPIAIDSPPPGMLHQRIGKGSPSTK